MHSYRWSDLVFRLPHPELCWSGGLRRLTPLRTRAAHLWHELPPARRYWAGSLGTGLLAACLLKVGLGGPASAALRLQVEAAPTPLSAPGFFAERGMTDPSVRFVSRGDGFVLGLAAHEMLLSLGRPPAVGSTIRMRLLGSARSPRLTAEDPLPQPASARIGFAAPRALFGSVVYDEVYPGIAVRFLGHRGAVDLSFVVDRGGSPAQIQLELEGADRVELTDDGGLLIAAGGFRLVYDAPTGEQGRGASPVETAYEMHGPRQVGFRVGAYDIRRPLVLRLGRALVTAGSTVAAR
jgi:hypothetical protein